jgi:hypothetical protein
MWYNFAVKNKRRGSKMKGVKNLMLIGVILGFGMILSQNARAMLFPGENESSNVIAATEPVITVSSDEQAEQSGMIPSDETLEPIPGFGLVTYKQLIAMLYNFEVKAWPPIVYVRDRNGRFFDSKSGALVGEFGHIEINPEDNNLVRVVTPTRTSSWISLVELLYTQQVGFLTALSKNGKKKYVVITGGYYRRGLQIFNFGHPPGYCVKYVDKSNKTKYKYLDLFTTQLGWNHIFYQPRTQEE